MVSSLAIIFMIISVAICFLLPIGLVIYFYKKHKIGIMSVLIGAAVFIVFQLLTRIPMLSILATQQWYIDMASNVIVLSLFLGLTAGIFEEVGRYIAMKLFMKKSLNWKNAVAFGIGHGGIEAIALVGLTLINYIVMSLMINSGAFEGLVAPALPAGVADQIRSLLVDSPTMNFLAGGFERIMTMSIQIAFSVIVMYSVKFKKPIYLLYAILLHALVDSPLVILSSMGLNVWTLEIFIAAMALVSLLYIIKSKAIFAKKEQELEPVQVEVIEG